MSQTGLAGRRVFVDTSAFFATVNRRDESHANAAATLQRLVQERSQLITANFIVAELHALLLARIGREVALTTLQELYASQTTTIVRVSEADELEARAIFERYDDKSFSFTDATCFAIMQRLAIQQAFTLDRNSRQSGFETIPGDG